MGVVYPLYPRLRVHTFVVARHAELPAAQYGGLREVLAYTVRPLEILEAARVVVQSDRTGMGDADLLEQVPHVDLVH